MDIKTEQIILKKKPATKTTYTNLNIEEYKQLHCNNSSIISIETTYIPPIMIDKLISLDIDNCSNYSVVIIVEMPDGI